MKQQSNEWYQARLGRFTASQCAKLMGVVVKGNANSINYVKAQGAQNYILEKVAETLTGNREEIHNKALDWGNELEPDARDYFELATGLKVEEIGIVESKENKHISCSPDGLIGDDAGIEIKCPFNSKNHILHMMVGNGDDLKRINKNYYFQIQMCLMLTGRKFWYFASYDPRFTGKYRMHIVKIMPNYDDIQSLSDRLEKASQIKESILKIIN